MDVGRAEGGRVLVCEDNPLIADGWSAMLRDAGYMVVGPTPSAEAALEQVQRQVPDLALVDIGLLGGVDGVSVAVELASLGVSIIFVTADYRRAAEARHCATDILIKPVTYSTLVGAIAAAFERKGKPS